VKWLAALATAVQCTLLLGIASCTAKMVETFRAITASGSSDPQLMAQGIGQALVPVVLAVGFSTLGMLVSVVIIAASRYRARWFYSSSVASAIIHILTFPIGTAFGLAFLVLLIVKRREFRPAKEVDARAAP
jgi:hypothetical protein